MATSNVETSKKGYAAFDKGDVETVLNDYDDNVEFEFLTEVKLLGGSS